MLLGWGIFIWLLERMVTVSRVFGVFWFVCRVGCSVSDVRVFFGVVSWYGCREVLFFRFCFFLVYVFFLVVMG